MLVKELVKGYFWMAIGNTLVLHLMMSVYGVVTKLKLHKNSAK